MHERNRAYRRWQDGKRRQLVKKHIARRIEEDNKDQELYDLIYPYYTTRTEEKYVLVHKLDKSKGEDWSSLTTYLDRDYHYCPFSEKKRSEPTNKVYCVYENYFGKLTGFYKQHRYSIKKVKVPIRYLVEKPRWYRRNNTSNRYNYYYVDNMRVGVAEYKYDRCGHIERDWWYLGHRLKNLRTLEAMQVEEMEYTHYEWNGSKVETEFRPSKIIGRERYSLERGAGKHYNG